MTDTPLKPCPFCGSGVEISTWDGGETGGYLVECMNDVCAADPFPNGNSLGSLSIRGTDREKIVQKWNTRPGEDALVEALKETVRVLTFAFEEGALPEDIVMGLCVDPYGMLKDARAALAKHGEST